MKYCQKENIQSILVEGGAKTLEGFYSARLADTILQIRSAVSLEKGIKSPFEGLTWEKLEVVGPSNTWLRAKENLSQQIEI
jgi:riboflavin biosynthesis pyrimidine reductase